MPRRRCPASFVCKGCGAITVRRPSPARDSRRSYCSDACKMRVWWQTHEKLVYPPLESTVRRKAAEADRRRARRIEEQIERVHWHQARTIRFCSCGATITRSTATLCKTCYAAQLGTVLRHAREVSRIDGLNHVCPNCGHGFLGWAADVYCSKRCFRQYSKHQRYPGLRSLPLTERNQIAAMIALIRAANRRIDESLKPGR
jgi:hypothetical protein